jgi:hypothetical protein
MKNIPASFACAAATLALFLASIAAQADDAYVYSTEVSSNGGEGSSVNIGYRMKATSRIEVDFQYPETPTKDILFGAWGVPGSDATPGLRMAFWNTGGKFCFILDSDAYYNNISTVNLDNLRHTAVIDAPNRAFRLLASDGTVEWSGSVASGHNVSGEATWPIVLFGCARNAAGQGNQHTKARIYSVKIYETENGVETLACDLVPCMKNDDVGFYDNRSGIFHHGQSTLGSLVCGGDNVKTIRDAYLETPSSNYSTEKISFNTGYFMKTNSWLAVDFQWLGTPKDLLFGPYDDGAKLTTGFWINAGVFSFLYKPTGGYASYSSSVARDNNRHTAIIDARDGNLRLLDRFGNVQWSYSTGAAAVNNAAWPIVLFGATSNSSGAGKQWSYARIFSAKFYEGDDPNPVKEFVPYVKDGAPGFLETVGGVFTEVKGISAGGDVGHTKCSYIENDGMTVLNLGYKANMRSRIEVDYMCLNPSVDSKVLFGAWNGGSLRYLCWNSSNVIKFIFHGKSSADPQYVSSYAPDALRHTAIMDMKNQHIYYLTGNVTNYSKTATAGTFNETDTSYPMGVFGSINNDAGTNCDNMTAKSRFYSVRIYEDEELVHEFLPYTDGTTNSLRDVITGHVATKVKATFADPVISGMGADGEERWFVRPQDTSIGGKPVTLKAAAAGAVLRYKWTFNGEEISGGSNGELAVSWRKTGASDVYTVTPVYSVGGAEIEGEAVSATVDYLPLGLTIIVR